MILSSSQTLKQILRQRPMAVEILEQEFGLLFWDRMETTLSNLCASMGMDSYSLLERMVALPAPPSGTDWDAHPIYWLIDHLAREHVAFREMDMPSILALMGEDGMLENPDGYAVKTLLQEFLHFQAHFLKHMADEEEFLFPKIMRNEACFRHRELDPEVFRGSVNLFFKLETHQPEKEIKSLIVSIREKFRNQQMHEPTTALKQRTQAALDGFADRLHRHSDLENKVLFPRAGRLEEELYENSAPGLSRFPGDQ